MPSAKDAGDQLALQECDQIALAAAYLTIMNAHIAVMPSPAAERIRDAFRDQLALGPLGPVLDDGRLKVEQRDEHLEDVLAAAPDTARNLALLVDLCASQPFADASIELDARPREAALGEIAVALGGDVDEDDIERIDEHLHEGQRAAKSQALKWILLGVGGVVGVATAGLAAPAIGAAIGSAMGLSGAAATAAGLAAIGGGSLAAGGFGMAGGTAIVLAAGGAFGAGVGTLLSSGMTPQRLQAEALKLFAVVRCLDTYSTAFPHFSALATASRDALSHLHTELERQALEAAGCKNWERYSELDGAAGAVKRLHRRLDS